MIYDIQSMKDLGFNMLRKHIKVECARWYYHCDKIGMIVWQDMVSGIDKLNLMLVSVLPFVRKMNIKDTNYSLFGREDKRFRDEFEKELFEKTSKYLCELLINNITELILSVIDKAINDLSGFFYSKTENNIKEIINHLHLLSGYKIVKKEEKKDNGEIKK